VNPEKESNTLGDCDVVIIGAGIIGSMVTREFSRFEGRIVLLEKEPSPGWGVSKGSLSMIHAPDFCPPGTLKGKLCVNAPERFKRLSEELDVRYREVDELWLALDPFQLAMIEEAKRRGESHGGRGFEIITGERVRALEPHVNPRVIAALYVRGLGVIYPPEWAFALIENAIQNGVRCHFQTKVLDIQRNQKRAGYLIKTSNGDLSTRWIVNCGGLFADEIASMVGDKEIHLTLTKGTMAIFDKSVSHLVRHMLYGTFSQMHSQAITPTVHGNLLLGLGCFTVPEHKNDLKVEPSGLREIMMMGKELVPSLCEKHIIATFAGIRSEINQVPKGDFLITNSSHSAGVIHAITGQPGLTAAPAVADRVIDLLSKEGFSLKVKKSFQPRRQGWPVFCETTVEQKQELILSDSRYGRVVCRCEGVTEGEIISAVKRGADTLDEVKHLTRAGTGHCQGGFCGMSLIGLLGRQLGRKPHEVTKKSGASYLAIRRRFS
jgi:glycerol-3-phosphate dehydrogenase